VQVGVEEFFENAQVVVAGAEQIDHVDGRRHVHHARARPIVKLVSYQGEILGLVGWR